VRLRRENSCTHNGKRISSDSTNSKSIIKPVESRGKTREVKKVSVSDDHCVEKLRKQLNFYARKGEIKSYCS